MEDDTLLKDFMESLKKQNEKSLRFEPNDFILTNIPKVKNEIVWNYRNVSGLCNFSALMFAHYIHFTMKHLKELINANHSEKIIDEIFNKSSFPEVNKALYYGQTVLALFLYSQIALSYSNDINSISRNHFYTHFNCLDNIEPNIEYKIEKSNIIDVETYDSPLKDKSLNEIIMNSEGIFKMREYCHTCCLYLNETKAIYINNSLLTLYPLVCDKSKLIENWKKIRRWNKEEVDTDKFDCISLYEVIYGLQRINFERIENNFNSNGIENNFNSNQNLSISGGSKNNGIYKIILIIFFLIFIISLFSLIFCYSSHSERFSLNNE